MGQAGGEHRERAGARRHDASSAIPLTLRVPRTRAFVGRGRELAWLQSTLREHAVVSIHGPGGIGKSTLAYELLARPTSRSWRSCIRVTLPPDAQELEALIDLLRAIFALERREERVVGIANVEAARTALVDMLDEKRVCILLDGVSAATLDALEPTFDAVRHFVSRGRILVTTRAEVSSPRAAEQALRLAALDDDAVRTLASGLGVSDPDAVEAVLRSTHGWPLGARRLLAATAMATPATLRERSVRTNDVDAWLLEGVSPASARLLETLALFEIPVAPRIATALFDTTTRDGIESLRAQGLVEELPAGLVVHDVVRDLLLPRVDVPQASAALGRALLPFCDDARVALEALRLLVRGHAWDEALTLATEVTEPLLAGGDSHRLWRTLADVSDPRFVTLRIRIAHELGTVEAVRRATPPAEHPAASSIAWARALLETSRADEAKEVAKRAESEDEAEARLMQSLADMHMHRIEEGLARLVPVASETQEQRAKRLAVTAGFEAWLGRSSRALAIFHAERPKLHAMRGATRDFLVRNYARLIAFLGEYDVATSFLDEFARESDPATPSIYTLAGRAYATVRAGIWGETGDLREALRRMEQLQRVLPVGNFVTPYSHLATMHCLVRLGELRRARVALDAVRLSAAASSDRPFFDPAFLDVARFAGRSAVAGALEELESASMGGSVPLQGVLIARLKARLGEPVTRGALREGESPLSRALCAFAKADVALGDGDLNDAWNQITAWTALHEFPQAVDAAMTLADVALADGTAARRSLATARCDAVYARTQSAWLHTASALLSFEGAPVEACALLERVASLGEDQSHYARRAQALLGERDPELDALDAIVLRGMKPRFGLDVRTIGRDPSARYASAWGIDCASSAAWLCDGTVVSLAHEPRSWAVLRQLALHPEGRTKEELLRAVWDVHEYHPLRHDNRLRVAVAALRRALRARADERILATDTGYVLQRPFRIRDDRRRPASR